MDLGDADKILKEAYKPSVERLLSEDPIFMRGVVLKPLTRRAKMKYALRRGRIRLASWIAGYDVEDRV